MGWNTSNLSTISTRYGGIWQVTQYVAFQRTSTPIKQVLISAYFCQKTGFTIYTNVAYLIRNKYLNDNVPVRSDGNIVS